MDKGTKKKNTYNAVIIKELIAKYGFGRDYIQKSIRGERTGTIPLRIAEEYEKLNRASNKTVTDKINEV